ncbi:MAG: hypothetical protein JW819_08735 [Candidatus Krumholzibacteriota bacterium]|nr:hypothetical protein [Candidatus Krumholzibacteriota bacterium]
MWRFNTIPLRRVPAFLGACLLLAALTAGCAREGDPPAATTLTPEEDYLVEQYLRVVEARYEALLGDSLAAGRFHFLEEALPSDSLRAIARRISAETPRRWPLVFEEIVRRKQILEAQPR